MSRQAGPAAAAGGAFDPGRWIGDPHHPGLGVVLQRRQELLQRRQELLQRRQELLQRRHDRPDDAGLGVVLQRRQELLQQVDTSSGMPGGRQDLCYAVRREAEGVNMKSGSIVKLVGAMSIAALAVTGCKSSGSGTESGGSTATTQGSASSCSGDKSSCSGDKSSCSGDKSSCSK
ncbi:MAG: hypothetical protein M9894_20385 [Planctomycetes bacterium]|nr:hypothetical protein [Planctomycetota bacterium]